MLYFIACFRYTPLALLLPGHTEDVPSPQKVEIPEATLQAGRILFRRMSLTWLRSIPSPSKSW